MDDGLNKKMAIGYFWSLVAKWMNRLIGVFSMLILVRLLSPADFGIAALTNIVIALFIMMSEVGTEQYVIKAKRCTNELLNSAWSLNLTLKCLCAILIWAFSGMLAGWLNEPKLESVLLLCALIPIISALKNIGLVHYQRELNFYPLTRLAMTVKLLVFPVTIGLAVWLKNYWALVIGVIANEAFTLVGSYVAHPYRPKWSIKGWSKQWHFSKWMLVSTITGYIRSRIDVLLLGKFVSSSDVGTYRVSQEFAWLPFSEIISPATSSFYSGISKISHNRDTLYDKINQYLAIAYILVVPSVFGIYALALPLVNVFMGDKWEVAAPILGMLSFLMLSMPLNIALQTVLISLDKVKHLVMIDVVIVVFIVVGFYLLYSRDITDLDIYTEYRVALVSLFIFMLLLAYKWLLGMSLMRLLCVLCLPFLPALIMYELLMILQPNLLFSESVNLLLSVGVGAAVFAPLMLVIIFILKRFSPDYAYLAELVLRIKGAVFTKLKYR